MRRILIIAITIQVVLCCSNILLAQEKQPLRIDAQLISLSMQNPQMIVGYERWSGLNDSLDQTIDWKAVTGKKDRFATEIEKQTDYKMVTEFGSLIIVPKNLGENSPPLIESDVSIVAMTDKTVTEILSQIKGVSRKVKFLRFEFGHDELLNKTVSIEGADKIELGQLLTKIANLVGAKRWLLIHPNPKNFSFVELLLFN